jgi:hypothetical protein
MFENIKYYILNTSEKDSVDFSETIHKNFDDLRKNGNKNKCIIKIEGPVKEFLNNINSLEGPFTHSQIRSIIKNNQW